MLLPLPLSRQAEFSELARMLGLRLIFMEALEPEGEWQKSNLILPCYFDPSGPADRPCENDSER
jgi:hypothetical protein